MRAASHFLKDEVQIFVELGKVPFFGGFRLARKHSLHQTQNRASLSHTRQIAHVVNIVTTDCDGDQFCSGRDGLDLSSLEKLAAMQDVLAGRARTGPVHQRKPGRSGQLLRVPVHASERYQWALRRTRASPRPAAKELPNATYRGLPFGLRFRWYNSIANPTATELRVGWRHGLDDALRKRPDEVVPYKLLPVVVESVKQGARSRPEPFNTQQWRDVDNAPTAAPSARFMQSTDADWLIVLSQRPADVYHVEAVKPPWLSLRRPLRSELSLPPVWTRRWRGCP